MKRRRQGTPLCPAGHLPLKGGDQLFPGFRQSLTLRKRAPPMKLPISPLEGEMSGRTEGGRLGADILQILAALLFTL
ncbi:hypothetical protein EOA36_32130, partial [Mesorhizobium sp. M8A.F.Ca.ET.021.01.1.1]